MMFSNAQVGCNCELCAVKGEDRFIYINPELNQIKYAGAMFTNNDFRGLTAGTSGISAGGVKQTDNTQFNDRIL
jgi:hypothetical protein